MITVSLCMIVKNEAAVLDRCLSSVADLMDEIIIVDTGSTDGTKEIAGRYTQKIYDYVWRNDFAAARNFAFSKASMEYIYSADADELLDAENRLRFFQLKSVLLPEIEIVQMHYLTKSAYNTVANFADEYRPKLFRRLRSFTWIDAVHETVRLDPVVFDSDIEILHLPQSLHSKRDLRIFREIFQREGSLSKRLHSMCAKELYISGAPEDLLESRDIFEATLAAGPSVSNMDQYAEAVCVLARAQRLKGNADAFFSLAFHLMPDLLCSELCYEIGCFFREREDLLEAAFWFENACQKEPVIDARCGGCLPLQALTVCYRELARRLPEGDGRDAGAARQKQRYLEQAEDCARQLENLPDDLVV